MKKHGLKFENDSIVAMIEAENTPKTPATTSEHKKKQVSATNGDESRSKKQKTKTEVGSTKTIRRLAHVARVPDMPVQPRSGVMRRSINSAQVARTVAIAKVDEVT